LRDDNNSVYGPATSTVRIPILPPGDKHQPTYYQIHGDLFGWICLAIGVMAAWKKIPMPKLRKWGDV